MLYLQALISRVFYKSIIGSFGSCLKIDSGVFFCCNQKFDAAKPALMDLAPTVLELFGVPRPGYMEGKSIFEDDAEIPDRELVSSEPDETKMETEVAVLDEQV